MILRKISIKYWQSWWTVRDFKIKISLRNFIIYLNTGYNLSLVVTESMDCSVNSKLTCNGQLAMLPICYATWGIQLKLIQNWFYFHLFSLNSFHMQIFLLDCLSYCNCTDGGSVEYTVCTSAMHVLGMTHFWIGWWSPIARIWAMWSTALQPLLPGPLWPGLVVPIRFPSKGQIEVLNDLLRIIWNYTAMCKIFVLDRNTWLLIMNSNTEKIFNCVQANEPKKPV